MDKWTMIGTPVLEREKAALHAAAQERGTTASALIYSILYAVTDGFTQWESLPIPEKPVRGFRMPRKKEY